MQTTLAGFIDRTAQGEEARAILRSCVHCGFCLATCPTYQLLADEQDSPRGRIYLIKQLLEGEPAGADTRLHLDRCLTCRACETTCPSGVKYGRLVEIGRAVGEARIPRPLHERLWRRLLSRLLASRSLFAAFLELARLASPVLPAELRRRIPPRSPSAQAEAAVWPEPRHLERVLLLEGCVQPVLEPGINLAAARLLDRIGVSAVRVPATGCCGALPLHLSDPAAAAALARHNIDAWWPHIEAGAQAIAITASACALMVREYGTLLREDARYAARAHRVSSLARDISEVVAAHGPALAGLLAPGAAQRGTRIAFHAPCTLQHGLALRGVVEPLLQQAGFELTAVPDTHLCCGSAGTYSLLQPELSRQLLARKAQALTSGGPALIASANIGCLTALRGATDIPVMHWIELLAAQQ
jgi:glycolate oxidase iron-sulfur subunit